MGDPRGRAGAPERFDAGYRQFQRTVARTTDSLDLHALVPKLRRYLHRRGGVNVRTGSLVGIATVLAIVGAVVFLLLGSDGTGSGRLGSAVPAAAPGPASLTISAGFSASGALTQEPEPLPDPNGAAGGGDSGLLDRALDPFSISTGGGGGSSGSVGAGASVDTPGAAGDDAATSSAATSVLAVPQISRLYTLTNQERAERGVRPVTLDTSLNETAQRHADWMAQAGVLCHASECHPGAEPDADVWNGWGENIGYSVSGNADELQAAFIASAPHLANMVDGRHRHVGFGWSRGVNREAGTTVYYVVVQFGMNKR